MTIVQFLKAYIYEVIIICNEMSPYLLLGFLIAGILHVYFPKRQIYKYLGKNNISSVFNAALLGVPLPLCSCGVIPTGVSLHKQGASKGSTVSFLISTPQTGVDSIMITYSLLGLPFALMRPVIALVTGVIGGVLTNLLQKEQIKDDVDIDVDKVDTDSAVLSRNPVVEIFRYSFYDFLQDIAKWLVVGILLAALISVVVPDDFFASYINNSIIGMLVMLLASVPLYVCATASVPIAAVMILKGISPGAALVFLMAGPATNVATITVIGKSLGKKTLAIYLVSIIFGALGFGVLVDSFLPNTLFDISKISSHSMDHEHMLSIFSFKSLSSIFLLGCIINVFIKSSFTKLKNFSNEAIKVNNNDKPTLISVHGMTCNHCKMSVERNLGTIEGITWVEVNLKDKVVAIYGESIDLEKVRSTLDELGFEYHGEKI